MTSDGLGGAGRTAYIAVARIGEVRPDVDARPGVDAPIGALGRGHLHGAFLDVFRDRATAHLLAAVGMPRWPAGRPVRNVCDRGARY
jgi:hypothetical protein